MKYKEILRLNIGEIREIIENSSYTNLSIQACNVTSQSRHYYQMLIYLY